MEDINKIKIDQDKNIGMILHNGYTDHILGARQNINKAIVLLTDGKQNPLKTKGQDHDPVRASQGLYDKGSVSHLIYIYFQYQLFWNDQDDDDYIGKIVQPILIRYPDEIFVLDE